MLSKYWSAKNFSITVACSCRRFLYETQIWNASTCLRSNASHSRRQCDAYETSFGQNSIRHTVVVCVTRVPFTFSTGCRMTGWRPTGWHLPNGEVETISFYFSLVRESRKIKVSVQFCYHFRTASFIILSVEGFPAFVVWILTSERFFIFKRFQ